MKYPVGTRMIAVVPFDQFSYSELGDVLEIKDQSPDGVYTVWYEQHKRYGRATEWWLDKHWRVMDNEEREDVDV